MDFIIFFTLMNNQFQELTQQQNPQEIGDQQINNDTAESIIIMLFSCFKNGLHTFIVTISRDWSVTAYLPGSQRTHLSLS